MHQVRLTHGKNNITIELLTSQSKFKLGRATANRCRKIFAF